MTATLTCSLDEFWRFLDPKVRNYVQSFTKSTKKGKGLICDECKHEVNELESAHKAGRSRRDIVKMILNDYETENEKYIIPNLQNLFERIKKEHYPLENNFRFLCKPCHDEYDKSEKPPHAVVISEPNSQVHSVSDLQGNFDTLYQKEFARLTSTNNNLRECLKQLFLKFPETSISTTELRTIYQKCHPNESVKQSQKVPNYMWELANYEKFLERESNSVYRLASKNKTTV